MNCFGGCCPPPRGRGAPAGEGALEEVAAVGDWYADSVRRADTYLAAAEDGDLDEVEPGAVRRPSPCPLPLPSMVCVCVCCRGSD